MNKRDIVLAGMAPAKGASYSPVQVQKLFFLIDRNIPEEIGGPCFDFKPYNYGPFDRAVYDTLEELAQDGLVDIIKMGSWNSYKLTSYGQIVGESILSKLSPKAQVYIQKVSEFVRKLSFTELVTAIYKAYPEMRVNSVFQPVR